ncbi:MAG TPA: Rmf/CrpP fold protein [Mycobacteriales bacterium]
MSAATDMANAVAAGEQAARDGLPLTDCPHRPDAPTARERVLATMWLRGHARVTPLQVDYSG